VKTGIVAGLLPFLVLFLPLFFLARFLIAHFGIPESLLLMLVIAIPIGVFVGWIGFAPTRKKASQLLCDTAYAKQRGFTPANLRLYSFKRKSAAS
jgi:hypothetical protein